MTIAVTNNQLKTVLHTNCEQKQVVSKTEKKKWIRCRNNAERKMR